jgi:hypothetical protein
MANSDATSSIVVGIIAIVAVFAVAYFGLMYFNQNTDGDTGTTAGIDVDVGTSGGNPPPPTYAQ